MTIYSTFFGGHDGTRNLGAKPKVFADREDRYSDGKLVSSVYKPAIFSHVSTINGKMAHHYYGADGQPFYTFEPLPEWTDEHE